MRFKGQLIQAQLENLAADPTNLPDGRVWVDTVTGKVKWFSGSAVRNAVTENQTQTLTNKTLTSPVINSPTGLTKADVGLSQADNTSDATKNAAVATLTNKTIDAASNTITNLDNSNIKAVANIARSKLAALTASRAMVTDGSGNDSVSPVTATELALLSGKTGVLVTEAGTQALTNKDIDGGTASNTSRITIPKAAKTTLDALTRKAGTIVFDTTSNKPYYDDGSTLQLVGSGSGGATNFITDGNAESGTTNYVTYSSVITFQGADVNTGTDIITRTHGFVDGTRVTALTASGALPSPLVNGTSYYVLYQSGASIKLSATLGGAAIDLTTTGSSGWQLAPAKPSNLISTGGTTIAWSTTTTNPLSDTNSFLLTCSSSTVGECGARAFTIDAASKGKVLTISFDAILSSGTYSNGSSTTDPDLIYGIYDVSNATFIQPSNYKIDALQTTISERFRGEFQAASNSTSYILFFHNTNVSSSFVAKIDNIAVSPNTYVYGTPQADGTSYTPTISAGFGTPTSVSFKYWREGDHLVGEGFFVTGTTAASIGSFSLPSGLSLDTTKLNKANTTAGGGQRVGEYGTDGGWGALVTATSTSTTLIYFASNQTGSSFLQPNSSVSATVVGSSTNVSVKFRVPIAGWGSSVQMADQTSTRIVSMKYAMASGMTAGANAAFTAWTGGGSDTHGAFNTTTGVYTVPVAGDYDFAAGAFTNLASQIIGISVNGSVTVSSPQSGNGSIGFSGKLRTLKVGDQITLVNNTGSSVTVNGTAINSYLSLTRVSGPSQIAASETVAASYWVSANFAASATVPINFDSKEFDTHNCVTPSATVWKFTAPIGGIYSLNGLIQVGAASQATYVYKNGTGYKLLYSANAGVSIHSVSTTIALNAGDYIDFRPNTSSTITGGALFGAGSNISISRIGNRG